MCYMYVHGRRFFQCLWSCPLFHCILLDVVPPILCLLLVALLIVLFPNSFHHPCSSLSFVIYITCCIHCRHVHCPLLLFLACYSATLPGLLLIVVPPLSLHIACGDCSLYLCIACGQCPPFLSYILWLWPASFADCLHPCLFIHL